jgi:hypothetical protein
VWVVLLTNGVHFGRDASAVKALRADVHAAVAAALLGPSPLGVAQGRLPFDPVRPVRVHPGRELGVEQQGS